MLIRCVDFETTGLPDDEGGAAVCEIGWCDIRDGVVRDGGSVLCDPGRPISPQAMAVHHIRDADVAGAPTAADTFHVLLDGAPDYFCAHNSKFEQAFFDGWGVPWICTYKVALRVWPEAPSHSNQVLRYWLDLDIPDPDRAMPPHRAEPDAYVTAHIMARLISLGTPEIPDMVRWSAGPPLLPRINFGKKHRGSKWEDAPLDYLDWIANKSDMDGDVKANARYHIKKRSAA